MQWSVGCVIAELLRMESLFPSHCPLKLPLSPPAPNTMQWSVGCVVAELLRMEPLFPARSEIELLTMQCNLLGSPSPRIWPVR